MSRNSLSCEKSVASALPKSISGSNYKVSADIGNPGVESIIINNEKQKTFSVILPKPRANIPEISPIIVLLIGLIVLGIL